MECLIYLIILRMPLSSLYTGTCSYTDFIITAKPYSHIMQHYQSGIRDASHKWGKSTRMLYFALRAFIS